MRHDDLLLCNLKIHWMSGDVKRHHVNARTKKCMLMLRFFSTQKSWYGGLSQRFDNSLVHRGYERAGLLLFVGGSSLHLWQTQLAPRIVPDCWPTSQLLFLLRELASYPGQAHRQCQTAARSSAVAVEGKDSQVKLQEGNQKSMVFFLCVGENMQHTVDLGRRLV